MASRELPVVGGNLALDFANTVDDPDGPTRHDHLGTYDELLAWSVRVADLPPERAAAMSSGAGVLPRAHRLRDVITDVFGAIADGTGDGSAAWPELRPFVAEAMAAAELDTSVHPHRWTWPDTDDPAVLLHPIAIASTALLLSDELGRVKRCSGCPWLFVDRSRNHQRRWCDMADCGTVSKMRRYSERRSAARRSSAPRAGRTPEP